MKILLTGKNGQVGWELQRTLMTLGEIIALDRNTLDLSNPDSIRRIIRETKPDLIVNSAAYTAVDKAESEPELAMTINGVAPGIIAEEAKRLNAAVIQYSTDYVFDGTKTDPYTEDDKPNPLSVYGKTKLAGENIIQEADVPHLILRTSWVYGLHGRNFLRTILKLGREQSELKIINDQYGAPTWSRTLAESTAQIISQFIDTSGINKEMIKHKSGTYHITAGGETTWYGFAKAILEKVRNSTACKIPNLLPISTDEYVTPAKRPHNSILSNEKIMNTFGIAQSDWEEYLDLCLQEECV